MELRKSAYQGDLYFEDECFFSSPYRMDIVDDKNKKIGEVTGHIINTEAVSHDIEKNNGSNFFIALDCMSQLLCNCASYILKNIRLREIKRLNNIVFLNRLSLDKEYLSTEKENEVLDLIFEHAEMVIYSYGFTELDDDFPDEFNEEYDKECEKFLKDSGWAFDQSFNFYIKKKEEMWTREEIQKRIDKPFKSIKLTHKEFPFWSWLLSLAADLCQDCIFNEEYSSRDEYLTELFHYHYSKNQYNTLKLWEEGQIKNTRIELSPFSLYVFLDYIDEMKDMRGEDSGATISFVDEDVESNIDKILDKYYKLFYKTSKLCNFKYIYEPIIERYLKETSEFEAKRIHAALISDRSKARQLLK